MIEPGSSGSVVGRLSRGNRRRAAVGNPPPELEEHTMSLNRWDEPARRGSTRSRARRWSLRNGNRARLLVEALECRALLSGTWTALAHSAPSGIGTMELLSDGTVM